MAIYEHGLLGPIRGKSGPLIGSNWRSINYLRSLPVRKKKPATEKQLAARLKFIMASEFLSQVRGIIRVLPRGKASARKTDFNEAMSIVLKSIKGEYPNFAISFEDAVFTRGSLMGVLPNLQPIDGVGIKVSWSTRLGRGASYDDQIYTFFYNPDGGDFHGFPDAIRSDGEDFASVEDIGAGVFHVWSLVYSNDGLECSNSRYLGWVELKDTEVPKPDIADVKADVKLEKSESNATETSVEEPVMERHTSDNPARSTESD